ncbi:MAG: hypothetical protein ABI559_07055 [Chloroflexota bacterium]
MRAAFFAAPIVAVTLAILVLTTGGSTPAIASFHEMRIYGVMGGAAGSTGEQFVELREAIGNQRQVQNAQLCFYDSGGFPWARFVFPHSVTNGDSNASILIGSALMESDWNAGADAHLDFTFDASNTTALNVSADVNAPIPLPNGNIVYESNGDVGCGSPDAIDSIAYGTGYTGVAFFGTKFNHDLPQDSQGFQLDPGPVDFPPSDNSAEYNFIAGCITARSNAGYEGTVGGGDCLPDSTPTPKPSPTPTASPTGSPISSPTASATPTASPTATPAAIEGDADCDGDVDTDDGLAVLRNFGSLSTVFCPGQANVNCDGADDPLDALLIFKYLANLTTATAGCTPIGQTIQLG